MRKKTLFWMLTLVMMSAASVNAQVIIGGDGIKDPHAGAGLDLSPLGTQKLGLLLPNVELTDDAEEFALVAGATNTQKTDATGMLVYNADDVLHGKGLYIWNGTRWQALTPAPTIKDAEGNEYFIGDFGDAGWWMTENLRSKQYSDGTGLTANRSPGTNDKYYWYPNDNQSTFNSNLTYGLLYTWTAASGRTNITDNEENKSDQDQHQGICPSGWHLPSDYEWTQLTDVISASADGAYSTTTGTGNVGMKMNSTTTVNSQATNGTSNSRTANGFDALLVGIMYGGSAYGYGEGTYFWSSSSGNSSYAWCRGLDYSLTGVDRNSIAKYSMFSVRCKKNE
jgi:uncharacterized protein (TIGR02145 family)